jgi:hypothetical protein
LSFFLCRLACGTPRGRRVRRAGLNRSVSIGFDNRKQALLIRLAARTAQHLANYVRQTLDEGGVAAYPIRAGRQRILADRLQSKNGGKRQHAPGFCLALQPPDQLDAPQTFGTQIQNHQVRPIRRGLFDGFRYCDGPVGVVSKLFQTRQDLIIEHHIVTDQEEARLDEGRFRRRRLNRGLRRERRRVRVISRRRGIGFRCADAGIAFTWR